MGRLGAVRPSYTAWNVPVLVGSGWLAVVEDGAALSGEQLLAAGARVDPELAGYLEQAGFTEEAAHKHLRKLAMDRGQKLADAAERIIEARDLLRPAG